MSRTSSAASLPRTAALISGMTLLSRLLGLARDVAMAWLLGGSPAAEALVIAMRVPHMIRRLFAEGSLSMSITAALVRLGCAAPQQPTAMPRRPAGRTAAQAMPQPDSRTAQQAARQQEQPAHQPDGVPPCEPDPLFMAAVTRALHWRLTLVLGSVVAACCLLAGPFTHLLAPAADSTVLAQAIPLFRLCLPYALAASLAALGMGLLHSQQCFLLPALAPVLFNCAVLASAALAACGLGDAAFLLAGGMLAGGLLQWASQRAAVAPLWRAAASVPVSGALVWRVARGMPSGALGAAAPQLVMLCTTAAASALPTGALAALYYAERLLELPLGLLTVGLSMAGLPLLSRLSAAGAHTAFAAQTSTALRWSLLLTLPAAAALAAVAEPLIRLLLAHGAFDEQAVRLTTLALLGYLPALPACGLTRPLLAACHAHGLSRLPLHGALLSTVLAGAAALGFLLFADAGSALLPLTLSGSLALWTQPLCLWHGLNRRLREQGARLRLPCLPLVQMGCAAAGTGYAASLTAQHIASPLWSLCAAIPAGMLCYALLLRLFRNGDALDIFHRLRLW